MHPPGFFCCVLAFILIVSMYHAHLCVRFVLLVGVDSLLLVFHICIFSTVSNDRLADERKAAPGTSTAPSTSTEGTSAPPTTGATTTGLGATAPTSEK